MNVKKVYSRYGAYYALAGQAGSAAAFMLLDPLFDSELGEGEPLPSGLYRYIGMREYAVVGNDVLRARTFQRLTEKERRQVQLAHERALAVLDPARVSAEVARQRKLAERVVKGILDNMIKVPGTRYRMGRTEVTEAQWDVIMKTDLSVVREGTYPASGTSWDDCQEFIKKLNQVPAVKAAGLKFRLPTVAEWRYACRAGSRGNWGMLSTTEPGNLPEMGWYVDNSRKGKSPVAQKKPNAWGFYDMHGNVFEWCADVSAEYGGDFRSRVGGGYNSPAEQCAVKFVNSANRQFSNYSDQGFRLLAE